MSYVSMAEAQAHLKQKLPDDLDDIAAKIDAAESRATQFLNRPLSELLVDGADSPPTLDGELDPAVKLAVLQLVEAAYLRDPDTMQKLIDDAHAILYPFRIGLGV